jgi:hypothetical protein
MVKILRIPSILLIMACASVAQPRLGLVDCLARNDCVVVKVDNSSGQSPVAVSMNGAKYLDVSAYDRGAFAFYRNKLTNGNCAIATVRIVPTQIRLISEQACIYPGQYYIIDITNNQRYVWLTPLNQ